MLLEVPASSDCTTLSTARINYNKKREIQEARDSPASEEGRLFSAASSLHIGLPVGSEAAPASFPRSTSNQHTKQSKNAYHPETDVSMLSLAIKPLSEDGVLIILEGNGKILRGPCALPWSFRLLETIDPMKLGFR